MKTEKSAQLYIRLLGYLRPYSLVFSISIFGMILAAATEVALPVVLKPFLDGTFIDKDPSLMTLGTHCPDRDLFSPRRWWIHCSIC
jgi:subfamily B ATP-binding cassette protein MsbA